MPRINLIKRSGVFIPSLPEDEIKISKIKSGTIIEAEIKCPRNSKFHRKFFALLQVVLDGADYDNVNQILILLKFKLGHYDKIENTNGKIIYSPKSISFASMDNIEFQQFYNQAVDKIISDFLPSWKREDVDKAVDHILRNFG